MKTAIMISIIIFLSACGGTTPTENAITPPQPSTGTSDIKPPKSPSLE